MSETHKASKISEPETEKTKDKFVINWISQGKNNIAEIKANTNYPNYDEQDYDGVNPEKPTFLDAIVIPGIQALDVQGYKIRSLTPIIENSGDQGTRICGMLVLTDPRSKG